MKKLLFLVCLFLLNCSSNSSPTEPKQEQLPIVYDMSVDVSKGHFTRIPLRSSFSNDLDYKIVSNPTSGHARILFNQDIRAKIQYEHDLNGNLQDSFKYQVSSGELLSNISTISLNMYQTRIFYLGDFDSGSYSENSSKLYDVISLSDGGYLVVGETRGLKGLIIKLDTNFNQEWKINDNLKTIFKILETRDGNFIISNEDGLKKMSKDGEEIWTIQSSSSSNQIYSIDVKPTGDGGYVTVGLQQILKIDSNGNEKWSYSIDDGESTSNYIFTNVVENSSNSNYKYIAWGIKTGVTTIDNINYTGIPFYKIFDENGNNTSSGYELNSNVVYSSALISSNGNYMLVGRDLSSGLLTIYDTSDMSIKKTNYFENANFVSIKETSDSGFIIVGYTTLDNEDGIIVKLNSDGNILWFKNFDSNQANERFLSVFETQSGEYIVCGYTDFGSDFNNAYLIKIDSQGNILQ